MSVTGKEDSQHKYPDFLSDYEDESMSLPDLDSEPLLLISQVRKYYMDFMIKLLSFNYENNQRLINKNIYLPSAIWRCAKMIEMQAARTSMVVQLYRKNIVSVIQDVKKDTKKKKLYKMLYECLRVPPANDKKLQVDLTAKLDCGCECLCNKRKKRRTNDSLCNSNNGTVEQNGESDNKKCIITDILAPINTEKNIESDGVFSQTTTETHNSDNLMQELEKLFQGNENDDDDIFEGTCGINLEINSGNQNFVENVEDKVTKENSVIDDHTAQIKSLDERLASIAGLLVNNNENSNNKNGSLKTKHTSSKWLCEEYFLKVRWFELLDQIGDTNRKKLARIKAKMLDMFGGEEDDEREIVSPLDETPEFVISCKERIAPWVVKDLTPYYMKGRIIGKALFKSLAKHLIRLIHQCSNYPQEYEVHSFVMDFLKNHKMIRREADFKEFRIENI